MNRTDRLTGIILALQSRRQTTAQLAERFEVSRRTILRDVDALSQIGVPVAALPGAGGGLEIVDGYRLNPVQLTTAEASALLLAARSLTAHPGGPLAEPGQRAVDKLRAALRPEVLRAADRELGWLQIEPPRQVERLGHFRAVQQAIVAGTWLRIDYQSLRRIAAHVVLPLTLAERDGLWYCTAISEEARQQRRYRLDRVLAVELVHAPPEADEIIRQSGQAAPDYGDPSNPEVVVGLTSQGAVLARDLQHGADAVRRIDDETWEMRFRCPPNELQYWARTFFGFGPQAQVSAPAELRALVVEMIRSTAALYPAAVWDDDLDVV